MSSRGWVIVGLGALILPALLQAPGVLGVGPPALPRPALATPGLGLGFDQADGIPEFFGRACEDGDYEARTALGSAYHRDAGYFVAVRPQGDLVVVAGDSFRPGFASESDFIVVAYDAASGGVRWLSRYDGPGGLEDHPYGLVFDPAGQRVLVSGWSAGEGTNYDYAVAAFAADDGRLLWRASYDGPVSGNDYAWSLRASPDGARVYVTGLSDGEGMQADFATIALDAATGARLWTARHDGGWHLADWAYILEPSPDGRTVFVEGWVTRVPTGMDYALIAYDAATGQERWASSYAGPGSDLGTDIAVARDGSIVVVTGFAVTETGSLDLRTVAFEASTGATRWVAGATTPQVELYPFVRISPQSDRVFVLGSGQGVSSEMDFSLSAFDAADGAQRWARTYDDPSGLNDFAASLALAPDGQRAYMTGCSSAIPGTRTPSYDVATVAVDTAMGEVAWVQRFDGPDHGGDAGWSVAANPDGTGVVVTGWSEGADSGYDLTTFAYDAATGAERWASRLDQP
jgi:hypothetical protein